MEAKQREILEHYRLCDNGWSVLYVGEKKRNEFYYARYNSWCGCDYHQTNWSCLPHPAYQYYGSKGKWVLRSCIPGVQPGAVLTSYSLPMAVSKLVSARVSTGQYKNAYRVLKGAMTFAVLAGGIVAAIVFFGAGIISTNILKMDLSVYALRVLAPCILIVAILGVLRGFFQGYGTMIPTAFSQILEQIVNAIVSVTGAYLLLNLGKTVAQSNGNDNYKAAFAAAGGTLGTVMGR